MTAVAELPTKIGVDDIEVWHLVCCCNEDLALCGEDLTGHPFGHSDVPCPICHDVDTTCPRCGRDCDSCGLE